MDNQINMENLTLDDNTFEVLPDGDYRFTVKSHEVGYATSEKMPPNTQTVLCMLEIPYMKDGMVQFATVRNQLNLYSKGMFAVRQFTDSIGLTPEKGRISGVNLNDMDGKTGVCALNTYESKNGNEFNNVQMFYVPSKAPLKTANDEAWKNKDGYLNGGFTNAGDLDVPFTI